MSSLSPRQPISAPRYAAPLRLGLALLASLVGETRSGFAQDIRDEVYVTDGTVVAVAQAGGTIYIGGNFSYVGPSTGSAVPIDAATGAALGLPKVAGTTYAVAPVRLGARAKPTSPARTSPTSRRTTPCPLGIPARMTRSPHSW